MMSTIPNIAEKFAGVAQEITEEKGPFLLFALALREDSPDRWDLLVSASWFGDDKRETLNYFADKIRARIGAEGLIALSRIVLVEPTDEVMRAVTGLVRDRDGKTEMRDAELFGLPVRQAYIITAHAPELVPAH